MGVWIRKVEFAVVVCDLCQRREERCHETSTRDGEELGARLKAERKIVEENLPEGWVQAAPDRHVCPQCVKVVSFARAS